MMMTMLFEFSVSLNLIMLLALGREYRQLRKINKMLAATAKGLEENPPWLQK